MSELFHALQESEISTAGRVDREMSQPWELVVDRAQVGRRVWQPEDIDAGAVATYLRPFARGGQLAVERVIADASPRMNKRLRLNSPICPAPRGDFVPLVGD